jgi:Tol biopolymer transport system component
MENLPGWNGFGKVNIRVVGIVGTLFLSIIIIAHACAQINQSSGQRPPYWHDSLLVRPVIAAGIRGTTFSPNGRSVCFVDYGQKNLRPVLVSAFINGKWSIPDTIKSTGMLKCADPFISPDGSMLFFANFTSSPPKIFVIQKSDGKWGNAMPLNDLLRFPGTVEWQVFPTLANNGNLYFAGGAGDIYCSSFNEGEYSEPVMLSDAINTTGYPEWDACISRDENLLIFCSKRDDTGGESDLYISCRKNGKWMPARNLGPEINSDVYDGFPGISPDGKYLFFIRDTEGRKVVYQVDLKPLTDKYLNQISGK